jgi:signal transduction histidine kinase
MPAWLGIFGRLVLDWVVLSASFYNAVSLSWLGLMVLLIGNRRALGSWLTGGGLLLGALFFTSHTAILGRGLGETGLGMNFWWWISWTPAAVAPLAWYGAMLWHAGISLDQRHPHKLWILMTGVLALMVLLLLLFANPLPNYQFVAGRVILPTPSLGGIPILILTYLAYSLLCYLLPLDLLRRQRESANPFFTQSRRQARPWLGGASLAMLFSAVMLAVTATWAVREDSFPGLSDPLIELTVKRFDLVVSMLVAIAVTLLGRAIVAYEVFTGRPLPRDRFTSQWRGTVFFASGFGMAVAGMLVAGLRPVYALMAATALATLFFVLISWRAFNERETLMARLRPFLAGRDLLEKIASPQTGSDPAVFSLFETLVRDLLAARSALLVPAGRLAALAGPPLVYPPGEPASSLSLNDWKERFNSPVSCLPAGDAAAGYSWAVPLWSQDTLAGVLFIGEKSSGGPFSEEEIELAQAGGERLLDRLAGAEVARLSLELLRQRLGEARVLEGQGRRVLHDEVLPELHTALLTLSSEAQPNREALAILSQAHRRISDLLRSGYGAPDRLAREGLVGALRSLLENDFAAEFASVVWEIDPAAAEQAHRLQPFMAETAYFAARELVRNAAKYARGDSKRDKAGLTIHLTVAGERLHLEIEDDGVGPSNGQEGNGSGLRIHSAMLAAAGGSLEVRAGDDGVGTRALIVL